MRTLSERTVGLLESRQSGELAAMVLRLGGVPVCAPAVQEKPTSEDAGPVIARIIAGEFPVLIAMTGASVTALFDAAERLGSREALQQALTRMTIVCRGPKPQTALKRHGLTAQVVTPKPHTTRELLETLAATRLDGVPVALLHYGERNLPFSAALAARGAKITDVCLYEYVLPDDVAPLEDLVDRILAGEIDALLVTSQIQFRFLLDIAATSGRTRALLSALSNDVIVGAVGPVCASAIRANGVIADVLPASPNSASLVGALADYFDLMIPPRTITAETAEISK